jgi:adenylate cyclase
VNNPRQLRVGGDMTQTDELLIDKEISGLKITFYVKIGFLFILIFGSFSPAASRFEKVFVSGVSVILMVITLLFLFLIRKRKRLTLIGAGGAIIDVLLIGILPIIWYRSVGGFEVSPAYLLKTMSPFFAIGLIITNSLAVRPLYPLIVSIGSSLVYLGLLVFALQDERTVLTNDFVEAFLGPSIHRGAFGGVFFLLLIFGGILAFITYIFRKTIHEAVYLEKANFQMRRYFSPAVAEKISQAEEDFLRPGGQRQKVAVMFCDIREFTTLSETLSPEEVIELLSKYHSKMVDTIFRYGGTLDKFIGDGIMATFGTPEALSDDVERAVKAGIAMKTALHQLNQDREVQGITKIQQGIGIHFGSVVVGNIGTLDRLEYTVVGDTVNLASRIESACKELKESFLISETVKAKIGAEIQTRDLGNIAVKGKSKPIQVFAVDRFVEKT